jgi:hypothetical protein
MFLFGHTGLTIVLILFTLYLLKRTEYISKIDFRIVLVLAILPDIIDKLIGHLLFYNELNNGRLFFHSLLVLFIMVIILYKLNKDLFLIYSFPLFTHQIFDFMWDLPTTWFWPYYGLFFEKLEKDVWGQWLTTLMTDPFIQLTEILGFIFGLLIFIYFKLYLKTNFINFMKKGKLYT